MCLAIANHTHQPHVSPMRLWPHTPAPYQLHASLHQPHMSLSLASKLDLWIYILGPRVIWEYRSLIMYMSLDTEVVFTHVLFHDPCSYGYPGREGIWEANSKGWRDRTRSSACASNLVKPVFQPRPPCIINRRWTLNTTFFEHHLWFVANHLWNRSCCSKMFFKTLAKADTEVWGLWIDS